MTPIAESHFRGGIFSARRGLYRWRQDVDEQPDRFGKAGSNA